MLSIAICLKQVRTQEIKDEAIAFCKAALRAMQCRKIGKKGMQNLARSNGSHMQVWNVAGNELIQDCERLHTKGIKIVEGVKLLNALMEVLRILER